MLQTDIVGSTRLNETLGDAAMSALWGAHDRMSRDLLQQWRGREVERSDGFLLLFATASDALNYAVEYHRALASLPIPLEARAGLHVGPLSTHVNPTADVELGAKPHEVRGLAVSLAARVMSLAAGGQTLLTAEARAALGATPLRIHRHGHYRMKGVEEPAEIFEAGTADTRFVPPADSAKVYRVVRSDDLWLPRAEVRHSLPAQRDGFVGRHLQLRQLAHAFEAGARLVTVLGIGGTGKTRLVQRFGWMWLGDFAGGVWFCDLSQARSLDGILHAVAQGLDVPLGGIDPVRQLGAAIAGRGYCLVILDNFEQVAGYAAETLHVWLDRAPDARFIVTSRALLGIPGEHAMALEPLSPVEGVELFQQRAQAARSGFLPTQEDRAATEPLVRLLDGLPLAIELAAARVRVMPPRTLLARMSERFSLLASRGGRPDRQATLRAAFDWSWELLSVPEKSALARISVFEGGFTLSAAEYLLAAPEDDAGPSPIDLVQSLVEKSLVRQIDDQRFTMLVSVQEYAAEHLRVEGRFPGSGSAAVTAARMRHWRYFSGLDERAAVADGGVEIGNLVTACRRAATHGDTQSAVRAMDGAWAALKLRGPFRAAVDVAADIGNMPGLQAQERAVVSWVAGSALYASGHGTLARSHFDAGLGYARAAGDRRSEIRLLCALSDQLTAQGMMDDAFAELTKALALAREVGEPALECNVLNSLGALFDQRAQMSEARTHYELALALARSLADRRLEGGLLGNLGGLHHSLGRLDDARGHYEKALRLAQQVGDRRWEGNTRCNFGLLHHDQGRDDEARTEFELALTIARELGHARLECIVLCNLGIVVQAQGDLDTSNAHYERAIALARELGDRRSEGQFRGYLGLLRARLGRFSEARDCLAVGETLLHETGDSLSLALLLCSRAEAEHLANNGDAAREILRRTEALALTIDAGEASELGRALEHIRCLVGKT